MIKVGLIGIGGMGRTHYVCYENIPAAQIVAICDVDERKLAGDWSSTALNIDTGGSSTVDLSNIKTYQNYQDLINDPDVQLIDICLPTKLHAPVTVAALQAGKDVFCEKPMAFTVEECAEMERALEKSGRQLMIGHCLRYWPHYVEAQKIIAGGAHGAVLYARLQRAGGTPWWSWNNWLITGSESGGAVLDMHIHDVDTALWWFGRPDSITADGIIVGGTPNAVDSIWRYDDGKVVSLHGIWDNNGGPFSFSFKVVMERATVVYDSASGNPNVQVIRRSDDGDSIEEIAASDESAYESEIRDYIECLDSGRKMERITPAASRVSVEVVREELRQIVAEKWVAKGIAIMADEKTPQYEALLKNQERILINQKQIKQGQRQLSTQQEKLDIEVIANQQTILSTQEEMQAALKEIKFQQKQLKTNQDRLDVFFSTLETVIANQDKIQANQRQIIENQMKILDKIGLLAQ